MKDIMNFLINESRTRFIDIEQYGNSWIKEWGSEYCGDVLKNFIKGVERGMKYLKSDDVKFQKRCEDCISEILEKINKDIY